MFKPWAEATGLSTLSGRFGLTWCASGGRIVPSHGDKGRAFPPDIHTDGWTWIEMFLLICITIRCMSFYMSKHAHRYVQTCMRVPTCALEWSETEGFVPA